LTEGVHIQVKFAIVERATKGGGDYGPFAFTNISDEK